MTEKEKLCQLVDEFAKAMKKRLMQKHAEGFRGWEDSTLEVDNIPENLFHKASEVYALCAGLGTDHYRKQVVSQKTFVDIANFAMFLWRKIKEKS
jgi:hypothetical protein